MLFSDIAILILRATVRMMLKNCIKIVWYRLCICLHDNIVIILQWQSAVLLIFKLVFN